MNKDILSTDINKFCQATHLVEAIAALHGKSPIPTHQQGSKAIDDIFLSPSLLEDAQGGFLDFGEATISDHQAVWMDTPAQHFNMLQMTDITRAAGRRLKCQDPRIVSRYNQFLANVIKHKQLIQMIQEATSDTAQESQGDTDDCLEQLDQQWTLAKINAECYCRKLNTGTIP